jgi:hypothetical protein
MILRKGHGQYVVSDPFVGEAWVDNERLRRTEWLGSRSQG